MGDDSGGKGEGLGLGVAGVLEEGQGILGILLTRLAGEDVGVGHLASGRGCHWLWLLGVDHDVGSTIAVCVADLEAGAKAQHTS